MLGNAQANGHIVSVQQIQSVGNVPPYRIVVPSYAQGTAMSPQELMAIKLKWIARAGYRVLTNAVPAEFLPYNAVIRVNARNTEDSNLDYLAQIVADTSEAQ